MTKSTTLNVKIHDSTSSKKNKIKQTQKYTQRESFKTKLLLRLTNTSSLHVHSLIHCNLSSGPKPLLKGLLLK